MGPQFGMDSSSVSELIRGEFGVFCSMYFFSDLCIFSAVSRWADSDDDIIINACSVLLALWPTVWAMSAIEDSNASDVSRLADWVVTLDEKPPSDDMTLLAALRGVGSTGSGRYEG